MPSLDFTSPQKCSAAELPLKNIGPVVIDLFCGIGGLSLGAARAGFEVGGAVDFDPHAILAHSKNFRATNHIQADVSALTGTSLLESLALRGREITGIIGGPPCQGFSHIGRRDQNDTRNGLFGQFFRIVNEVRPAFFVAENVPGIMAPSFSDLRDSALDSVRGAYQVLPPLRLSANDYGAPTVRTRVFFVGYLPDAMETITVDRLSPPTNVETVRVKDALDGLPVDVDPSWQRESDGWRRSVHQGRGYYFSRLNGCLPTGVGDPVAVDRLRTEGVASGTLGTAHSHNVATRYAELGPGERDPISKSQRLDPDGFCPTLRAGTGSDKGSYQAVRPIHPTAPRVITPREAGRLQGFPDWFLFPPTKWHSFRGIGSSVSPIIAERLMSAIYDRICYRAQGGTEWQKQLT